MQTDLSNKLEALITEGERRSKKRTVFLVSLGAAIALIGLSIAVWTSHESAQKARQAAELAKAQTALRNAQIAEKQARVVSLQVNQLIATGAQQAHIGRFSNAAQTYEAALKLDPDNTVALQLYGYLELRQGNFDKAVSLLRHAVSSDPKDPWAHYNFALALYGSGDTAGAIDQIRQLVGFAPEFKQVIVTDHQFDKLRKTPEVKKLLASQDGTH